MELPGILDGPECGFISACLLQQHRAKGHQVSLVLRANSVGSGLQGCLGVSL